MTNIDLCTGYLQENIQPFLEQHNFYWNEAQACFQHQQGSFLHSLKFGLRPPNKLNPASANDLQLYLQLELQAREVERLVQQFRKFSPPEKAFTVSFCTTRPFRSVKETDLNQMSQKLERQLGTKAIPLLNRFSAIRPLDALFNRNTYQPNQQLGGLLNRCFKGLVLARFSHRRRFTDLYQHYLHRLDRQWAPRNTMENFTKLYQFLRVYALN